jgi:hypothetical protein
LIVTGALLRCFYARCGALWEGLLFGLHWTISNDSVALLCFYICFIACSCDEPAQRLRCLLVYLVTEDKLKVLKRSFSLLQRFQPDSGIHPGLYPVRTCISFLSDEAKRPACETDTSPPSSVKAKNQRNYTSSAP